MPTFFPLLYAQANAVTKYRCFIPYRYVIQQMKFSSHRTIATRSGLRVPDA